MWAPGSSMHSSLCRYSSYNPFRYGPWNVILTTLFHSMQGYIVSPQPSIPEDKENSIPEVVFEVIKSDPRSIITLRTVLIVKIKNNHHWPSGINTLEQEISELTNVAFAMRTAHTKVYWISVIGPHWRYGERVEHGRDLVPLVDWHNTTHDKRSYMDLQKLVASVCAL